MSNLEELEWWWTKIREARYARYWIAEEMAQDIINELPYDEIKYIKFSRDNCNLYNGLTQLFKKEWFR